VALRFPHGRPVRAGHRRVRVRASRRQGARRFFERAIGTTAIIPVEVVTDQASADPAVLGELLPPAWHCTEQYDNNRVEADHGRLKAWLRPMRALAGPQRQGRDRRARLCAEHPPGTLRTAVEAPVTLRLAVAFAELALAI
jgi:transposase, IS6 family